METKNQIKNKENKNTKAPEKKQKGKGVNIDSTPATEKANPRAGSTLKNEGTNVSYQEDRS